jgi:TniQ
MIHSLHAPAQLPFAPRPAPTELLSSWLLRVASANLVPLRELLDGFNCRYGWVLTNAPIDYGFPETATVALARFCRVPPKTIRMLDVRQRIPGLTRDSFLRLQREDFPFPRCTSRRLGYAFCPSCIASQRVIHVPWEWSLSYQAQCSVHGRPLLECCPACGAPDPLTFTDDPCVLCRCCGGDLRGSMNLADIPAVSETNTIQHDYRFALAGAPPISVPNATARAFRLFFEDIFRLLTPILKNRSGPQRGDSLSRQDILAIITALVLNAAPNPNQAIRRLRCKRGLRLWATLLSVISESDGGALERSSIDWPLTLRQRFVCARHYRQQTRWPNTPYRAGSYPGKPIERSKIASEFGLRKAIQQD